MKMHCIAFVLFVLVAASGAVAAQSGIAPGNTPQKANKRQPTPEASPTVTPAPPPTPDPADESSPPEVDGEVIKVNTRLVSLPLRVMDKKGRFIAGLAKENFQVFENGVQQEIALFSNEHQPFTVALVLDMSYSTKFKIAEIQSAALQFIEQLRPQDKVMVVSFDGEISLLCEPTNDRERINRAIRGTKIATGTSLYEAVDFVINRQMRRIEGRKAVILFSDGVDTTSRKSTDYQNLNDAMELDALFYTIKYDTFADVQSMKDGTMGLPTPPIGSPIPQSGGNPFPFPIPSSSVGRPGSQGTTREEYEKAGEYLDQLAVRTGGRLYEASTVGNLTAAYGKIASELREFYSVGYYPDEDRTVAKRASIKVKVDQPGLVVRSRDGFLRRKERN